MLGFAIAFALIFYDPSDDSLEEGRVSSERGTLYFFITLVGLPVVLGFNVIYGADYSLIRIALGTVGLAILAGIAGTLTDKL